jgi:hypothetical protein
VEVYAKEETMMKTGYKPRHDLQAPLNNNKTTVS